MFMVLLRQLCFVWSKKDHTQYAISANTHTYIFWWMISWTRRWFLAAIHHRFSCSYRLVRHPTTTRFLMNFFHLNWRIFFSAFNIGHEGDIALTDRDGNVYEKSRVRRNTVRQRKKVWPNRMIPFEMEEGLGKQKCCVVDWLELSQALYGFNGFYLHPKTA